MLSPLQNQDFLHRSEIAQEKKVVDIRLDQRQQIDMLAQVAAPTNVGIPTANESHPESGIGQREKQKQAEQQAQLRKRNQGPHGGPQSNTNSNRSKWNGGQWLDREA
jgi:hypothetical protein